MIELFNLPNYSVDTSYFNHILHDKVVNTVENKIANFVGAKYGVGVNSATNALFLSILNKYDLSVVDKSELKSYGKK